jgi:GGDEF domain-containing protein
MKELRLWIIILIIWLTFIFNLERLDSPVNIRSHTYIFIALAAAITLVAPRIQRIPFWVLLMIPVPLFLISKAFLQEGPWNENLLEDYALPVTLTQISAIILTGLLARQINHGLQEFEDVIAKITFGRVGQPPRPFAEGQGAMYNEVKRARRYQRPLAVIALKIDDQIINMAAPKIVKEIQQSMLREFVLAGIARIIDENTYDFDTIALHDNYFVVVMPEAQAEQIPMIAQRLEKAIKENLDVKLAVGMASFPNDAITFEKLVEVAMSKTESSVVNQSLPTQSPQTALSQKLEL